MRLILGGRKVESNRTNQKLILQTRFGGRINGNILLDY